MQNLARVSILKSIGCNVSIIKSINFLYGWYDSGPHGDCVDTIFGLWWY